MSACEDLVRAHTSFLKEGFDCERLDDARVLITTPYKLPDGDLVELVVETRSDGSVRVGDEGETLATLTLQGFDPSVSDKRRWWLDHSLRSHGVELVKGELRKQGPPDAVGALMLDVAATARAVADLIYLHRSVAPQDFEARVVSFLRDHATEVQPKASIKGLSGHAYRLAARAYRPDGRQLLVTTLAPRTRNQVKGVVDRTVRQWVDINHDYERTNKVSFLNDTQVEWPVADLRLLHRFSVITGWRTRHHLTPVLEGAVEEPDFELALPLWDSGEPDPDAENR